MMTAFSFVALAKEPGWVVWASQRMASINRFHKNSSYELDSF